MFDFIIAMIEAVQRSGKNADSTSRRLSPERFATLTALLQQREQLLSLLQAKNMIGAIKLFREETDCSLLEAKQAVEQIAFEMQEARREDLNQYFQQNTKLESLLRADNKIAAIKLYREETGVSLGEAKIVIEQIMAGRQPSLVDRESRYQQINMDQILQVAQGGNKIAAIKMYREQTGAGLKEARETIESIVPGGYVPEPGRPGLVDPEELQRLLLEGRKIEAIKYYRQSTGVGLKEAKEAVDWLEKSMESR